MHTYFFALTVQWQYGFEIFWFLSASNMAAETYFMLYSNSIIRGRGLVFVLQNFFLITEEILCIECKYFGVMI